MILRRRRADRMLHDRERVVISVHPHPRALAVPVLVLLAASALASFGAAVIEHTGWHPRGILAGQSATALVWLLVVGRFAGRPLWRWWSTRFVITDCRVVGRSGVVRRTEVTIPLARVDALEVHQRFLDRIWRTGTLVIRSAGSEARSFDEIPRVSEVHRLLHREVFGTSAGDR